jgi:hypothetical protein
VTQEQALEEAKKRWGMMAHVEVTENSHDYPIPQLASWYFAVGVKTPGRVFYIKGSGNSWGNAFQDADGYEKRRGGEKEL